MPVWRETHPGVEELRVAVMGCVVNGPGESKHADIGISLPGTFEEPVAPVFIDGKLDRTLRGDGIVPEFLAILDGYVERASGRRRPADGRPRRRRRRRPLAFEGPPRSAVYTPRQLNGRSMTWVTPTFFFERAVTRVGGIRR